MKDGTMSMPESQEEESSPSENMQMELHSKGAVLTKAWSDLFSFITKYQAELTVKENAVEIADREISMRRKQLEEMKPMVEAGNDEISRLQDEIQTKERLLNKSQTELSMKVRMLQQVQTDLSCNMELLEKARSELLDRQSEHVRDTSDLERLKSELIIKQEQILIKDNLLKKLQNQLMKENTELRDQLELERRALELERRSHELTKKSLREKSKPSHGLSSSHSGNVIEIPDSPPTLDLSVEQADDFGLSNIISEAESQSQQTSQLRYSQSQESAPSHIGFRSSETFSTHSSSSMTTMPVKRHWPSQSQSPSTSSAQKFAKFSHTPVADSEFPQPGDSYNEGTATQSDVFFPLSVDPDTDSKAGIIDTSASVMYTDSEVLGEGQYSGTMPGTPSSETSDSNQGPQVSMSGAVSSAGLSPGQVGPDGKLIAPIDFPRRKSRERLTCEHCGYFTMSPWSLRQHVLRHTGERRFACPICTKRFNRERNLRAHLKIHSRDPIKCDTCGNVYMTEGLLKRHQASHLTDPEKKKKSRKKYSCEYCGYFTISPALLREHERRHTGEYFNCEKCDSVFRKKSSLKTHMLTHEVDKLFPCETCGKKFLQEADAVAHQKKHTEPQKETPQKKKKVTCEYCGYFTTIPYRLRDHIRRHIGDTVKCEKCDSVFRNKSTLKKHMLTHEEGRQFLCDLCGKSFPKEADAIAHQKKHTEPQGDEAEEDNKSNRIACHMCDLVLKKSYFKTHMLIHTGEKPIPCPLCDKRFRAKNNLKRHMETHAPRDPFKCGVCGNVYMTEGHLKRHELTHLTE
ncbi:zinc finger protein 37-like isoform X1 [Lineus longissimus]|uniref:zinc finger protein 37-like isoform X1 n=1 Tax=Lineus longissimus TaxID=88925 RepID=UPI00315C907C